MRDEERQPIGKAEAEVDAGQAHADRHVPLRAMWKTFLADCVPGSPG